MNARVFNHIVGRLSLRPPQAESLSRLARSLAAAPELLGHERDLPAVLASEVGRNRRQPYCAVCADYIAATHCFMTHFSKPRP